MPWTVDDVERHYGGLTDKQKRQWVHVANGALERGDDDGTAIRKANGAVNNSKVESVLYSFASQYLNAVRLQESANLFDGHLLNEADPKPRVEKDINGDPVVPSEDQFQTYFDSMSADHIQTMLDKTRERWADAVKKAEGDPKDAEAKAEVEAIGNELKAGEEALHKKGEANLDAIHTTAAEVDARQNEIRSMIQHVARCLMKDYLMGNTRG